jgi:hypothetical protein
VSVGVGDGLVTAGLGRRSFASHAAQDGRCQLR